MDPFEPDYPRPVPPPEVRGFHDGGSASDVTIPAPELEEWLRMTFIVESDSPLYNPDYAHLVEASLSCLWTNKAMSRRGRIILASAIIPSKIHLGMFEQTIFEQQMLTWFQRMPDYLILMHAPSFRAFSDPEACAVSEHELQHCFYELDMYGMPRFTKEGAYKPALREHDVNEFTAVVRRYGVGACGPDVREFVEAANQEPTISAVDIRRSCGTCLRMAA